MNKKIKIMIAQLNPTVGDLEKNSKIVLETYEEASIQKVDVLARSYVRYRLNIL